MDRIGSGPTLAEVGDTSDAKAAYVQHVRQVMDAAGWPWPEHLLLREGHMPRFVNSLPEFIQELQLGCHMDQIVVFPGGLRAIGQHNAVCPQFQAALNLEDQSSECSTAYDVLERLAAAGALPELKGKVGYRPAAANRRDISAGGSANACLVGKWEALREKCPQEARLTVYLCEVRRLEPQPVEHGLRRKRKSTMQTTMRERMHKLGMDVQSMLYWDDYSEGFFVGANGSGYDLHTDCIPTSNIGSVFAGHKLLAIWGYPDETNAVKRDHRREHFVPELSQSQVQALERTCCMALAPPGSLYVFSGANAHAVCNVGFGAPPPGGGLPRPSLVASSYEAYVGLHIRHAEVLQETCEGCEEDDSDMEDFQDEVASAARGIAVQLLKGKVAEEEAARRVVSFLRSRSARVQKAVREVEERMGATIESSLPKRRRRHSRREGSGQSTSSSSSASSG